MRKPILALTMGDPAGIGPEIILKTYFNSRAREAGNMIVVGYPEPFKRDSVILHLDIDIKVVKKVPDNFPDDKKTLLLMVPGENIDIPFAYGMIDKNCGLAAGRAIEFSADMVMMGEADAVVTAPINKESLNLAGFNYPGHTEFYKHLSGAKDIGMMLTLGNLRVIHVTTHTAIRNVPDLVKKDRIVRVAELMYEAIILLGIEKPRLAVCGLNPHAGEAGMFGTEEINEIIPAVTELQQKGMDIIGPLPPDTVFARAYSGEFDGVIAMFHDQGHIALKLIGFKLGDSREIGGVNTTLGMPIIRTSVDHGTAFDIAGKGIASPLSMIEAVEMAAKLAEGRNNSNHKITNSFFPLLSHP